MFKMNKILFRGYHVDSSFAPSHNNDVHCSSSMYLLVQKYRVDKVFPISSTHAAMSLATGARSQQHGSSHAQQAIRHHPLTLLCELRLDLSASEAWSSPGTFCPRSHGDLEQLREECCRLQTNNVVFVHCKAHPHRRKNHERGAVILELFFYTLIKRTSVHSRV